MHVTEKQVNKLNEKIGNYNIYAVDKKTGELKAAKVSKKYINAHFLDDLIQDGKLTERAFRIAKNILT